jgi:hypothetical protein
MWIVCEFAVVFNSISQARGGSVFFLVLSLTFTVSSHIRIYGCHDFQSCICFPQHLLEEGHEGKVRQWHELLCLLVDDVPGHTHSICYCYGGSPNVGCWLAKGSYWSWPQCCLVNILQFSFHFCRMLITWEGLKIELVSRILAYWQWHYYDILLLNFIGGLLLRVCSTTCITRCPTCLSMRFLHWHLALATQWSAYQWLFHQSLSSTHLFALSMH